MKLTLTSTKAPDKNPIIGQQFKLAIGDSLGRSADNTLVLPDDQRFVSSKHAEVQMQGTQLVLIDHSTNGTWVNNNPNSIGKGNSSPLANGDTIIIGEYSFTVAINTGAALPEGLETVGFLDAGSEPAPSLDITSPPAADPFAAPDPFAAADPFASTPAPQSAAQATGENPAVDDFDQWLEPSSGPKAADPWDNIAPTPEGQDPLLGMPEVNTDPLAAFDKPAAADPLANNNLLEDDSNDDWWQSDIDNASADRMAMPNVKIAEPIQPTPPPQPAVAPVAPMAAAPSSPAPAAAPVANGQQITQLAELLGLQGLNAEQEATLLEDSAAIIRSTADNLINMLRARASIKNELRASRTMIQSAENNPLKFSAGADDALQAMFANTSSAFLSPRRAVDEGFENIADHQVALLHATREAYSAMLSRFDPSKLESRFNTQSKSKSMLAGRKTKNWENYEEFFKTLQGDAEHSYNDLFGEAFAEAYEAKLIELSMNRR